MFGKLLLNGIKNKIKFGIVVQIKNYKMNIFQLFNRML